jgi:hypothetical protein
MAYLYRIGKHRHCLSLLVVLVVLGSSSLAIACDTQKVKFNDTPANNRVTNMNATSQVELNIFSGRADPSWIITNTETVELIAKIQTLPTIKPSQFTDNLGYRGITIKLNSNGDFIKVYQGVCQYQFQGKSQFFHDENRQLEKQLLVTGKPHLPENLYNSVLQEIEK